MNSLLILSLLCLLTVGQVLGYQLTAGETSLQGSVTGGVSSAVPTATRWIEFMDMNNDWSMLGNTYTVEAWIWHNTAAVSQWQPVLARHPGSGAVRQKAHFSIAVKDNSNLEVIAGCGCDSTGQNCGTGFSMLATAASFSVGTWQHVAVTFNGDGTTTNATATLYLEGQPIATSAWAAQDSKCMNRASQSNVYAPVTAGFMDDSATGTWGWTGLIDEIRLWQGVRSGADIRAFFDVGLMGNEDGLFAYYQFSPDLSVLNNATAPKEIMNKVANRLNGLPQPDPTDAAVFAQSAALRINSYSTVEGQSQSNPDLPPIPNHVKFSSWPMSNQTVYSVVPGYSPALQSLVNSGLAEVYGNPNDLTTVTVFVDCPANDCSNYTANWKNYYLNYTATNTPVTSAATVYLRIVTACPSGIFDSCGTCEGDNSACQCVVYHGFETERMSYILFEWSLDNLILDVQHAQSTLQSTLSALDAAPAPSNAVLRQQIYELMSFYNNDLTTYCGDLSSFMTELESAIPTMPAALIDASATSSTDGVLPFIPGFSAPP